jgi:hypothetical protein
MPSLRSNHLRVVTMNDRRGCRDSRVDQEARRDNDRLAVADALADFDVVITAAAELYVSRLEAPPVPYRRGRFACCQYPELRCRGSQAPLPGHSFQLRR